MLSCLLNNQRINCFDGQYSKEQLKKWSQKRILLCPCCGEVYEYCHGKVKSPYFRHMNKAECEDNYSESETEEHINGKRDLYEWLQKQNGVTDCILEGWMPETKQRPDIMFKYHGQQCVLEYQCSPISTEYHERHELYQAAGVKDIWICGTQKYFQFYHKGNGTKAISEIENHSSIYYDSQNKCLYQIDRNMNEMTYVSIISGKAHCHVMRNPFDYRNRESNFYLIKDNAKSYSHYSYYPSGRPTNKYPYPLQKHYFDKNKSLAKCMALNSIKLKSIN